MVAFGRPVVPEVKARRATSLEAVLTALKLPFLLSIAINMSLNETTCFALPTELLSKSIGKSFSIIKMLG